MSRYNTDKQRLKKLEKLKKSKNQTLTKQQSKELEALKAQIETEALNLSKSSLEKLRDYLTELKSLERATKVDLIRLSVVEDKL